MLKKSLIILSLLAISLSSNAQLNINKPNVSQGVLVPPEEYTCDFTKSFSFSNCSSLEDPAAIWVANIINTPHLVNKVYHFKFRNAFGDENDNISQSKRPGIVYANYSEDGESMWDNRYIQVCSTAIPGYYVIPDNFKWSWDLLSNRGEGIIYCTAPGHAELCPAFKN